MPKTEHISLKWDEFGEHAKAFFAQLRDDQDFTDVTLVSEDGDQQIRAHKVILASGSPVFSNLLKINPHPHPLIFMKGLKSEDLKAMVGFLYYGQTQVSQKDLASFLALAAELKLKGLADIKEKKDDEHEKEPLKKSVNKKDGKENPNQRNTTITYADHEHEQRDISMEGKPFYSKDDTSHDEILESDLESTMYAQFEYTDGTHSNIDLQKFHQQIESMMGKTSDTFLYGSKTAWSCNLCGKEATQGQIRRHIESKHITGVRHKCDLCDKSSKSRYALKVHKKRNH